MHKRLVPIAECLICAVEEQMEDLESICTQELGEVIDMIKDLSEAIYYDAVTEAMLNVDELDSSAVKGVSDHYTWTAKGAEAWNKEKEWTHTEDSKEGKSHHSRRLYIEAKESHMDKTSQMKELEKYAQELTNDIIEMVEDASPEERQYLSKKIVALANKITQLNNG